MLSSFSVVRGRIFSVRCCQAILALMLTLWHIPQSAASTYDGPAELPRVYMNTALINTPAPGRVTILNAGESLQAALNNASCGDTIELQAGATLPDSSHFQRRAATTATGLFFERTVYLRSCLRNRRASLLATRG